MSYAKEYLAQEPTRAEVDAADGLQLIEFGAPDCGFCVAIQSSLARTLEVADENGTSLTHHKIEDGSGRPLGRSFNIRLWPTLVLMRGGEELGRVVRPTGAPQLRELLSKADG
jgi:thioredoxin 1